MSTTGAAPIELPTGTVTFLFTDVEESTALATQMGDDKYALALAEHRELLSRAIESRGGVVFGTEGDAVFAAFARATDAVAAALVAQRTLDSHPFAVRIGVHTGEAVVSAGDYVGLTVHQAARVSAAGHGGQVVVSEATRQLAARELPDGASFADLGSHRLKDLAEPQHLFQLCHPDLRDDFPALRTLAGRAHNLPLQLTSFIGREDDLEEVERLVKASRLVTLTGVGGSGKTRLALHAAAELLDEFPDGVWLIDLAPVESADLVAAAAAAALQVADTSRDVIDAIVDHIGGRRVLLVFDNCEHVAGAAAEVVDPILRRCAAVHVLATSREFLGVGGEVTRQVASLSMPEPTTVPPSEEVVRYAAIRLFMERALAADPGFTLRPGDAELLSRICRRLDGIPLAIELAAPKIRAFDLAEIDRRLDDRFRLLSGGTRRRLGRQQTLRATVDWSYDLLGPDERTLLRRLAVFSNGFTLSAAEDVCSDDQVSRDAVADLVEQLVGRSLVVADRVPTGTRYRQLETIRQYGFEKLADAGEVDPLRARHLGWCLRLAADAEGQLVGRNQREWLDRLDAEAANLRGALDWATDNDAAGGLDLAARLVRWWQTRAGLAEGRARLTALIEHAGESIEIGLRARGLLAAGWCAGYQNDLVAAQRLFEDALAAADDAGDGLVRGLALSGLGFGAGTFGDHARGIELLEEAASTLRSVDPDTPFLAGVYSNRGGVTWAMGDLQSARAWYERAVEHAERVGQVAAVAFCSGLLAQMLEVIGDYRGAEERRSAGIALARELGDKRTVSMALLSQSQSAMERASYDVASTCIDEMETLVPELGETYGVIVRAVRAGIELGRGDHDAGIRLADEAIAAMRGVPDALNRVTGTNFLARYLHWHGEYGRAREWLTEAIEVARGSPSPLAWTIPASTLALVSSACGDDDGALDLVGDVLQAELDGGAGALEMAGTHFASALCATAAGDAERATSHAQQLREVAGTLPRLRAMADATSGAVALDRGELAQARELLAASAAVLEENMAYGFANVLRLLAEVAVAEGGSPAAATACGEAVREAHAGRFPLVLAAALETTAALMIVRARHSAAARLLAGAAGLRTRIGAPVPKRSVHSVDATRAAAQAALGEDAFAAAWDEGERLDRDAAVELALQVTAQA